MADTLWRMLEAKRVLHLRIQVFQLEVGVGVVAGAVVGVVVGVVVVVVVGVVAVLVVVRSST